VTKKTKEQRGNRKKKEKVRKGKEHSRKEHSRKGTFQNKRNILEQKEHSGTFWNKGTF
jgi:hypothetical protein